MLSIFKSPFTPLTLVLTLGLATSHASAIPRLPNSELKKPKRNTAATKAKANRSSAASRRSADTPPAPADIANSTTRSRQAVVKPVPSPVPPPPAKRARRLSATAATPPSPPASPYTKAKPRERRVAVDYAPRVGYKVDPRVLSQYNLDLPNRLPYGPYIVPASPNPVLIQSQLNKVLKSVAQTNAQIEELQRQFLKLGVNAGVMPIVLEMLQKERLTQEINISGLKARSIATQKKIAELSAIARQKFVNDPIHRQLKIALTVALESQKRMEELVKQGVANHADLAEAKKSVAELEIRLLEHHQAAKQAAGGSTLQRLNQQLIELSIQLVEAEARLRFVDRRLAGLIRLQSGRQKILDLTIQRDALMRSKIQLERSLNSIRLYQGLQRKPVPGNLIRRSHPKNNPSGKVDPATGAQPAPPKKPKLIQPYNVPNPAKPNTRSRIQKPKPQAPSSYRDLKKKP